jgi:catechol 2,3-dioxygenase-like lactoylglutathione lyase family enzyme
MTMRHVIVGMLLTASMAPFVSASAEQQAPTLPAAQQRPVVRMGTKPQELLMAKITVSDLVKSYEFYTQIIGLKLVTSPDFATPKAPTQNDPEKDFVEIPLNYSGSMADPLFVPLGFKVPDSRVSVQRAIEAGYKAPRGVPAEGLPGFVADPDGYNVEFVSAPSFANQ